MKSFKNKNLTAQDSVLDKKNDFSPFLNSIVMNYILSDWKYQSKDIDGNKNTDVII